MRELQKTVRAQGIIVSSWGGTRIETWLSAQELQQLGGNDAGLELVRRVRARPGAGVRHWGENCRSGGSRSRHQGIEPWDGDAGHADWKPAPAELKTWEDWGVPSLAAYDGMMWYRAHVKLTKAQAKQAAKLSLGVIDDVDMAWINGRRWPAVSARGARL